MSRWRVVLMVVVSVMAWKMLGGVMGSPRVNGQHFANLARSFMSGRLDFVGMPDILGYGDAALHDGKWYWPQGPLPAVLLAPLVAIFDAFDRPFLLAYVHWVGLFLILVLVWNVARRTGFAGDDRWWAAAAFCMASAFWGVVNMAGGYEMAQVMVAAAWMLGLAEYMGKRRPVWLGLAVAVMLLTRVTAGAGILFFAWGVWKRSGRLRDVAVMLVPVVVAGIVLGWYNQARFGSVWESGYSKQLLWFRQVRKAREYGVGGLVHVPGNLYHFLLAGPKPVLDRGIETKLVPPYVTADTWGMGIFVTSPYFLWLVFRWRRMWEDGEARIAAAVCGVILAPLLLYYGIGVSQFGYRYSLDFLPLLFWVWLKIYRQEYFGFSPGMKALVVGSALFNGFLMAVSVF